MDVSEKFTILKIAARKFYSGQDDLAILRELVRYGNEDIKDMFLQ